MENKQIQSNEINETSQTAIAQMPISMVIEKFKSELRNVCNQSQLPISIIAILIQELNTEVQILNKQQTEKEMNDYNASAVEKNNTDTEL